LKLRDLRSPAWQVDALRLIPLGGTQPRSADFAHSCLLVFIRGKKTKTPPPFWQWGFR
jgi:hypothetical protein